MGTSLTRDWERQVGPLVEWLIDEVIIKHPLETDDGELASALENFLCDFIEAIEERSTFSADCDLCYVIDGLAHKKTLAHLLAWQHGG